MWWYTMEANEVTKYGYDNFFQEVTKVTFVTLCTKGLDLENGKRDNKTHLSSSVTNVTNVTNVTAIKIKKWDASNRVYKSGKTQRFMRPLENKS